MFMSLFNLIILLICLKTWTISGGERIVVPLSLLATFTEGESGRDGSALSVGKIADNGLTMGAVSFDLSSFTGQQETSVRFYRLSAIVSSVLGCDRYFWLSRKSKLSCTINV